MYLVTRRRVVQLSVSYTLPVIFTASIPARPVTAISLCGEGRVFGTVRSIVSWQDPTEIAVPDVQVMIAGQFVYSDNEGRYFLDCVTSGEVSMFGDYIEPLKGTLNIDACTFTFEPGWEAGFVTLTCTDVVTFDYLSWD